MSWIRERARNSPTLSGGSFEGEEKVSIQDEGVEVKVVDERSDLTQIVPDVPVSENVEKIGVPIIDEVKAVVEEAENMSLAVPEKLPGAAAPAVVSKEEGEDVDFAQIFSMGGDAGSPTEVIRTLATIDAKDDLSNAFRGDIGNPTACSAVELQARYAETLKFERLSGMLRSLLRNQVAYTGGFRGKRAVAAFGALNFERYIKFEQEKRKGMAGALP